MCDLEQWKYYRYREKYLGITKCLLRLEIEKLKQTTKYYSHTYVIALQNVLQKYLC